MLTIEQNTQRRMLDALNVIGMSDTLLKVIHNRQRMDARLTYGGMV